MSGKVIHVIDDEPKVREALAFLLAAIGFAVRIHANASAFLEVLHEVGEGCVITDVRMPGMDGLALLRKLVADRPELPVIVMTGHADVPLAVEAMKVGAVDFVEKPFDEEVLLASIRSALARQTDDAQRRRDAEAVRARYRTLTGREAEVLSGLVSGKSNKGIAAELQISPRTVEVHRAIVMSKMQAENLSDLIRMVLQSGCHSGEMSS